MVLGPFIIPGDPGTGLSPIPPFLEQTTEAYHVSTEPPGLDYTNITCNCIFVIIYIYLYRQMTAFNDNFVKRLNPLE